MQGPLQIMKGNITAIKTGLSNFQIWVVCIRGGRGGDFHMQRTEVARGKFGKEPLKGNKILFSGRSSEYFLP